jgi:predicted Holliday junction resolvase-like endonuclease
MQENLPFIIIWIVIWLLIGYLFSKIYFQINIRWQRKNAVERSKNVLMWQVNEKIAPILPNFPYNYKDLVFIWKWIDYIVFNWLSTWYLKNIIFLEIKSWLANLNRNEKMIKDCISSWKVFYDMIKIKN